MGKRNGEMKRNVSGKIVRVDTEMTLRRQGETDADVSVSTCLPACECFC